MAASDPNRTLLASSRQMRLAAQTGPRAMPSYKLPWNVGTATRRVKWILGFGIVGAGGGIIGFSTMAVSFSVAQLDDGLSAGSAIGWAVVRYEPGQPTRYVSRIFLREQDAQEHAHRLTTHEVSKVRKDAGLPSLGVQSRFKT